MTDKELLEKAAKAAGIVGEYESWTGHGFCDGIRQVLAGAKCHRPWNSLTDDGDALRLAVALDIEIYQGDDDGPAVFAGYWGRPDRRDVTRIFCVEPMGDDRFAATRRAITRAAAALADGGE